VASDPPSLKLRRASEWRAASDEKRRGGAMRLGLILSCVILLATTVWAQENKPKAEKVPDAETAVKVAEAALVRIYGKKVIESERPFTARLEGNVWFVSGTLHCSDGKGGTTSNCVGGVATAKVSKTDGHILATWHTM
jgi:hypothetical protein